MKRQNYMDILAAEIIVYGGTLATRAEVYRDVLDKGYSAKAADMFAFGPRTRLATASDLSGRITLAEANELDKVTQERIAMEDRGGGI